MNQATISKPIAADEAYKIAKAAYVFCFPLDYYHRAIYDLKARLLVDNPIDRYSIGDRSEGLKHDADGGLTIYVQKDSPGKDKESDWPPAPDGPMSIISRMYGPEDRILQGQYNFPDPVKAN